MARRMVWLTAWVATGCAASSLIAYRTAPDYPRTDREETVFLAGLDAPVEVLHDAWGVAHVRAGSERDLMRAVGFLHGRDRFFQMDLLRRLAAGRVSEMVGEQPFLNGTTVDFDRAMRGWGLEEAARRDDASQGPESRDLLDAYSEGVQAAVRLFKPLEYRLLRVDPEPWTPKDTFLVARLVAWSVTHNWHQEATRLLLALGAGLDRGLRIDPPEVREVTPSLPGGEVRGLPPAVVPEVREVLGEPLGGRFGSTRGTIAIWPSGASNAWVVGGGRSASGLPILANDPHMTHMVPSLMYAQHISAPGIDAVGATVPGIPYILSGHNGHVAWGVTSTVADTVDLCIERLDPRDPSRVLGPDGWQPVEERRLSIRVREGKAFQERVVTVRYTRNGPAFNDLYPDLLPSGAPLVTVRWDVGPMEDAIVALGRANRVRDVPALIEALSGLVAPVQTVTAADAEGRIALFVVGRVPRRTYYSGAFPIPGWLAQYDWEGFLAPEDLPRRIAGGGEILVHANNLVMDPRRSDRPIQVDSAPSYRYDRIRKLLEARPVHTIQTVAAVQTDVAVLRGRLVAPAMVADLDNPSAPPLNELEARALRVLREWDFEARADSAGGAVFFATYREAALRALEDEVGPRVADFILSQRYSTNAVDEWFSDERHPVWDRRDTPEPESRAVIVREAFRAAVEALRAAQGPEPSAWRWGRLHDLEVRHPFGGREALKSLVNLPKSEASGGLDSVWKSHFDLGNQSHPFRAVAGPVWRMVVDLADPAHGLFVLDTGVSGWPGSPHYQDLHDLWKRGEYAPLLTDWAEVAAQQKGRWRLVPGE